MIRTAAPDDDGGGGFLDALNPFKQIGEVVSWFQDPAGNAFQTLKEGAMSMVTDVLGALSTATMPDLNTDWWLRAYAVSFAMAMFVAVVLLIPQTVRTARGHQSVRDLGEAFFLYFPLFLGGAMFGPMFGALLVLFFRTLTDSITGWSVVGVTEGTIEEFTSLIESTEPNAIAGGVVIGIVMMFGIIVATLLVLVILVVQLVTLYLTGVIAPLSIVWIIDPKRREFGMKVVGLWVGLLAAHPLVFFLLGVVFTMVSAQLSAFEGQPGLQQLVSLIVAVVAMIAAALSPFMLRKFAPVIAGAGSGRGQEVGHRGSLGPSSMSEVMSNDRAKDMSVPSRRSSSGGGKSASSAGAASRTGAEQETLGQSGTPSNAAGSKAATAKAGSASAGSAGTRAAGAGASASAGAAGAGAVSGGTAAAAGGAAATGVGLPVAAGIVAAGVAAKQAKGKIDQARKAADHLADEVDDNSIGSEGTG